MFAWKPTWLRPSTPLYLYHPIPLLFPHVEVIVFFSNAANWKVSPTRQKPFGLTRTFTWNHLSTYQFNNYNVYLMNHRSVIWFNVIFISDCDCNYTCKKCLLDFTCILLHHQLHLLFPSSPTDRGVGILVFHAEALWMWHWHRWHRRTNAENANSVSGKGNRWVAGE